MCYYFKSSVKLNMLILQDTVIDSRLEATRVLSTIGLRFEATGISSSAFMFQQKFFLLFCTEQS